MADRNFIGPRQLDARLITKLQRNTFLDSLAASMSAQQVPQQTQQEADLKKFEQIADALLTQVGREGFSADDRETLIRNLMDPRRNGPVQIPQSGGNRITDADLDRIIEAGLPQKVKGDIANGF